MIRQSRYIYHLEDCEELQNCLDLYDEIEIDYRDKIEDLDKFINQLKSQGLYNKELEEFIDLYCKFEND